MLPAGLQDVLPPEASHEADVIERLIACFATHGYDRVKPPMIEFEESLLAGPGAQVAPQTFRLMDPISQRMMGLRADITPQVARIAASRLANVARPLRLCYAGQVLRVRGSQLRPERQFAQVGAELIGASGTRADAEVVLLAAEALSEVGVAALSVDLAFPTLVGDIARHFGLETARAARLCAALDRKDAAAVGEEAGEHAGLFAALLRAAGPADKALAALKALALPASAAAQVAHLEEVVALLHRAAPGLVLTIDPVEHRGFEYQTGLSFTLFAQGVRGELGRGGRYDAPRMDAGGEPATGFTLYMDTVLRALPAPPPARRLYLPADTEPQRARALREEGWITIAGLDEAEAPHEAARRYGCSHLLRDGAIVERKD